MTEFSKKQDNNGIAELTKIFSSSIPLIQSIFQSNTTATLASNQISQTVAGWDLMNQIAGLNTYFGETINSQNAILQAQNDILNANILSSFALNNELYKIQSDSLITNLLTAFSTQDSLFQSLFGGLNGNITISLDGLNNNLNLQVEGLNNELKLQIEGLNNSINLHITGFANNLKSWISGNNNAIRTSIAGLKNDINSSINGLNTDIETTIKGANDKIVEKLSSIYSFLTTPEGEFHRALTDPKPIQLAEKANKLAQVGNGIALAALGLQMTDLTITALTSFDPFSKAAGSALAIGAIAVASGLVAGYYSGTFSTGGFPSMGQMFIAREAGPELVGTIGSRNAVVNNDQIVESVSAGVYKAVREAMNGGQANGQKAVITLDKRVLGEFTIGYINGKTKETGLSPILV